MAVSKADMPTYEFSTDPNKPPCTPASLKYDNVTYTDIRDNLAFSSNFRRTTCDLNWKFAMNKGRALTAIVKKAIAQRNALLSQNGKQAVVTKALEVKTTDDEFTSDVAHSTGVFNDLVKEVHAIFAQLKTIVNEIKELEKTAVGAETELYTPALQGEHRLVVAPDATADMWRTTAMDMQNALGTLFTSGGSPADIIKRLVKLNAGVIGIFNQPDVDKVILRMQALASFEFQVLKAVDLEAPGGWLTAPNHEQAVKKLQYLVQVEKAVVEQLSCDRTKMLEDIQKVKTQLEKMKGLTTMMECAEDEFESSVKTLFNFKVELVRITPKEFIDNDGKVRVVAFTRACIEVMQLKKHMTGVLFLADQQPTITQITEEFDQLMQFKQHVRGDLFKPEETPTREQILTELDTTIYFADSIYNIFKGQTYQDIVTIITGIRALFPECAPKDLLKWVTGMEGWNAKVVQSIPADCRIEADDDDRLALWIQKYRELSDFREKIKAVSPYTKDTADQDVITKNARYLEFVQRLKTLCNVTELQHAWTSVTDIHKALDPDVVNADALKTGAQAILAMKQEIVTTKALVEQYQANAAQAVQDEPSTANALKLEQVKNLKLESELEIAHNHLETASDRIRALNESTATLQDQFNRAVERVEQLEKETSTGSAVVRTVDIDRRVSRLLDQLQKILGEIPRRDVGDVGDAVQRTSDALLHCFPDESLQRKFVKELVLKLQSNVDPMAGSLRLLLDSLKRESVTPTARRGGEPVDEEH
jgi:hypothetical protein